MAKKSRTQSASDAAAENQHEIFTAKRLIVIFLTVEIVIVALMYPTFRGRWHMNKAKAMAAGQNYEKAYKHYSWLEKHTEAADSASFNLEMGNVCMGLEKYQEAAKYYSKLVRVSDAQKGSYYLLGLAYQKLGEEQRAMENFQKELEKNPTHPNSNFQLGKLYFQKEDYVKAMNHFSRVAFIPGYEKKLKPYWNKIETQVLEK